MSQTLNAAIELHDSELASVNREEGVITLHLIPAYLHRSFGRPGQDDGRVETQACALIFQSAHVSGTVGLLPAVISDGELRIGALTHPNLIVLPLATPSGDVELTLFLNPDYRKLVIKGVELKAVLYGEAQHVEEFSASRGPY